MCSFAVTLLFKLIPLLLFFLFFGLNEGFLFFFLLRDSLPASFPAKTVDH